jgi:branched-chain amino acid transport system permease protein
MIAYLTALIVLVAVSALVGLALNLQWGVAGLVNFGVVGFVALGAYATALLAPALGWFGGIIAAALICAVISTVLAFLSIRLEENYLAIVTIGFGEVVRILLLNEAWLTGGAVGIADIPRPFVSLVAPARYDFVLLAFSVALVAITFGLLEVLVRSPFGRVLRAVRDDATVAAALGKPVLMLRIKAFAIGGAVMGVAGALHAFYLTYIDPSQFLCFHGGDCRRSRVQYRFAARRRHHHGAARSHPLSQGRGGDDRRHAACRAAPRPDRRRHHPAADPATAGTAARTATPQPRLFPGQ